jgi:hypothetical protein
MKPRPLVIFTFMSISLVLGASTLSAQGVAEVRFADTKYRFVDVSFTGKNGVTFDCFYAGVPGSNELNAGGGFAFKRKALTLTPLVYAVIGKEGGERGVKIALLTACESNGWKSGSFVAAFLRTSGTTDSYEVLDTADLTRTLGTRWELGLQAGFFRSGASWNTQTGPLLKLNDARGAWAVSYRFGAEKELRIGRVFVMFE